MGRVGHNNMGASNALYDRSLLDWRKAQKTKASFGGTGVASMKVGDLIRVKNPTNLWPEANEKKARNLYPWKFEIGVVLDTKPYGSFNGREVHAYFPSCPDKTILRSAIEVVSESR